MPAVSKAQQRFMGMVHATQKGDMEAPSKEVEKVADTMKKVDAKDFASTKHKGLPTHVKERLKEIIRGVLRAEGAFGSVIGGPEDGRNLTEMSPNDTHFKGIMAMYDKGGSFAKKKVGAAVSKNPNASRNQIIDDLKDLDYHEILDAEAQLGLDETIMEEFKHVIHVDTPTQVVSKPIAAQIMALAKKGVRSNEIGLEMGFVGNQKAATDAFQKVKNQIYFALDKRNESVNEGKLGDTWRKNNKKGFVLKVGNIELKSAGPSNSHDILVDRMPWGTFMMDYEAGGDDWWVKPLRGKDFWVDSIDDLVKKIKGDSRIKESVNEAFNVRDLPTWLFDDPVDFEDWYEDGMKLDKGKGKLAPFSSSDEKKLFQLVGIWQDSEGDYQFGRGDYGTGKTTGARSASYTAQDDIKKFLTQKGKVVDESLSEAKYPTDLKVGSVIMGQGFTRLKGIDGGKYYKIVAMDDTTATLVPSDKSGNVKGSSKVRHKLDSIEGGIKTAKRGDENGIVVIKESVNEGWASGPYVGLEMTPTGPKLVKTFSSGSQAYAWVMKAGGGHSIMTKKQWNLEESITEGKLGDDCGCNENHDCGCGGVHEHKHIHEDLSADANGIAGLTASRASAVKGFLEKNNIDSNKLYLFLKKGNLKDRMDFVTALVGKPGNPIQKKVISQFSK